MPKQKMLKKKLQGQVAIVTGASRGLGVAIAELLTQAGASVALLARGQEELETQAERLRQQGVQAIAIATDVSDQEQVEHAVEVTMERFRRVDIVINNAALAWPVEEVVECDPTEWAYTIHVNLIAPFYLAHTVLPAMLEQGYGRIVNVSSGLSSAVYAGLSAYSASKAGLDQLTRIMALEVKKSGVTVNALYPGVVDTDMQADLRSVDTTGSSMDLSLFHKFAEEGKLLPPLVAARPAYWLVGPWSKGRTGEVFTFRDEAWLAQVEKDLSN